MPAPIPSPARTARGAATRAGRLTGWMATHPWLIGDPEIPGRRVMRRARWTTIAAIVLANLVGGAVVITFALFALPKPGEVERLEVTLVNLAVAVGYLLLALAIGVVWGRRRLEEGQDGLRGWLDEDRPPTAAERARVLRAPLRVMRVQAVLWGVAVLVFTGLNFTYSGLLALGVGLTVSLGGVTTSVTAYVLAELALRPIASRALSSPREEAGDAEGDEEAERRGVPGVLTRWLMTWALGTGVPMVGAALVAIVALTSVQIAETTLAITMLALAAIGLLFGSLVSILAAYATVHPIGSIRRGLEQVRAGDLDVELRVWDSTEVGLLQAGFNDMVGGLREREHIRDVFGRQVGEDVAKQALGSDIELGGELREVAVLFVDLVGSTTLAVDRPPEEVVERLNAFFAVVVDVVEDCGGWINKFEGDAALAIFGAPIPVEDAEGCALRAARRLDERLREEVPDLEAGIGVAAGEVVAGHIGAESRFEYTVIGDPVNQAARLTDLSKQEDPKVLASAETVDRAREEEARCWELSGEETLRGRSEPTRLARPKR